jgi:hypothetical protein
MESCYAASLVLNSWVQVILPSQPRNLGLQPCAIVPGYKSWYQMLLLFADFFKAEYKMDDKNLEYRRLWFL